MKNIRTINYKNNYYYEHINYKYIKNIINK